MRAYLILEHLLRLRWSFYDSAGVEQAACVEFVKPSYQLAILLFEEFQLHKSSGQYQNNKTTYLFCHIFIALFIALEQLISNQVLLPKHLVFFFNFQIGLERLVEDFSLQLLLATFEIISLGLDILKLAHQLELLA